MEEITSQRIRELGDSLLAENKLFFRKLKKVSPAIVDDAFREAHNQITESFNCLSCANCCKTISPIVTYRDVERMAVILKQKPSEIVERYLKLDNDGDFVFTSSPCPFLTKDNYCKIYEFRPKACREYPHTNRKRMHQILDLTLRNTCYCPVVQKVVEEIKKRGIVGKNKLGNKDI